MTAQPNDLAGLGMAPALASLLGQTATSITGTGTTQGTPLVYNGNFALLTTAAGTTACTLDSAIPVAGSVNVANVSTVTGLLFPPTGCTINGGSANASVNIPAGTVATATRVSATAFRVQFGAASAGSSAVILGGATDGVTAFAGGGQGSATQLTGCMANVTTVASANDSVKLPLGQAGMIFLMHNSAANSMQVFGAGTDTINAVATATGVAQAAGGDTVYYCVTSAPAAKWFRLRGA